MWLRSAFTSLLGIARQWRAVASFSLPFSLPNAPLHALTILAALTLPAWLSGCEWLPVYAGGRTLSQVECDAVRSDRERGVISTAWSPEACARWEKNRLEEARKIVEEAEK